MKIHRSVSLTIIGTVFLAITGTIVLADTEYQAPRQRNISSYLDKAEAHLPWTMPGINIASPAGYGAQWGNVGVGVGYQSRIRRSQASDGSMGVAVGIGDAAKYVGFETAVAVLSLTGSDAFERGSASFKLHRQLPLGFGVAVGRESAFGWGGTDGGRSWYGSVSKIFILQDPSQWFSAITLTAGLGDGRFRLEKDVNANNNTVNGYGSIAIRVQQPVAVIADWSGQDLSLGLSITPLRDFGLYISPSVADLTRTAGDGVRFTLGVGLGYTFI